jgi:uncharacterized protein (TIGR02246 family)
MTSNDSADITAVRDVLRQAYAAWAAGDADTFADLYADDATVVMRGVFHQGRSAVRDYMAAAFTGPLKGSRGVDDPQDIRIVGGSTAIVVSRAGVIMAGEQALPAEREVLATWVLSQRDRRWRIVAYTNTPAR